MSSRMPGGAPQFGPPGRDRPAWGSSQEAGRGRVAEFEPATYGFEAKPGCVQGVFPPSSQAHPGLKSADLIGLLSILSIQPSPYADDRRTS